MRIIRLKGTVRNGYVYYDDYKRKIEYQKFLSEHEGQQVILTCEVGVPFEISADENTITLKFEKEKGIAK